MTQRISIICAPPHSEFNPGLHSVDLAAYDFFKRNFPDAEVRFCLLHDPEPALKQFLFPQLPFQYELFYNRLEELYKSDLIIFWGDFLHNYPFHIGLSKRLVHYGIASDTTQALQIIHKHFLLSEAPDSVLAKTMIIGTNFFITTAEQMLEPGYSKYVTRLISGVNRIWTRDILSAIRVAHIRKDFKTNFTATDCSFLLHAKRKPYNGIKQNATAGVFLGRTSGEVKELFPFINDLRSEMNLELHWIPWFWKDKSYLKKINGIKKIKMNTERMPLFSLYDEIKKYDFIITDTYHLCLNSWRMGVPAVCLGTGSGTMNTTLTSKKKELIYSMYEAQDFYVFTEDIPSKSIRRERLARLIKSLQQPEIFKRILLNLNGHVAYLEEEYKKAIKILLG